MKIGLMVFMDPVEKLEEKFQAMVQEGFDNCQLQSWQPDSWTPENAEKVNALTEKYGIEISAFWCGWEGPCTWNFYEGQENMGLVSPTYRYARTKNLMAGGKFAKMLGVTDIISHMGFIPENPLDVNFTGLVSALRAVAMQYQADGQYLLFETGQETPTTLLRCIETIGTDNLGINLDTGNLILYGKGNPVDALDTIGKYVCNVHAKDGTYPTSGFENGSETPIGEGKVDFDTVIRCAVLMVIFYITAAGLTYLLNIVMIRLSRRVSRQMRHDVFERLSALPVSYFDRFQTGDIISTITYDVDTVNQSLSTDLLQILQSIVTVTVSFVMMLTIAPQLVLIFLITIPITILFTRWQTKRVRPLFRRRSARLGQLNGFVEEMLNGQ